MNANRRSFNVNWFDAHSGHLLPGFTEQDDGDTPGCTLRAGVLYVGGHFNVAGPDCQPNHTGTCSTRHHVDAFDTRDNKLLSWNPDANSPHGCSVSPTAGAASPSEDSSHASADTHGHDGRDRLLPALRQGGGAARLRRPNQLWVADLTYVRTWQGFAYLAFILDVYSRMIVGWQLATHMRSDLVVDALEMAVGLRQPQAGLAAIPTADRNTHAALHRPPRRARYRAVARIQGRRLRQRDGRRLVATYKSELVQHRLLSYEHLYIETLQMDQLLQPRPAARGTGRHPPGRMRADLLHHQPRGPAGRPRPAGQRLTRARRQASEESRKPTNRASTKPGALQRVIPPPAAPSPTSRTSPAHQPRYTAQPRQKRSPLTDSNR